MAPQKQKLPKPLSRCIITLNQSNYWDNHWPVLSVCNLFSLDFLVFGLAFNEI
jgi:hypothetical protein